MLEWQDDYYDNIMRESIILKYKQLQKKQRVQNAQD